MNNRNNWKSLTGLVLLVLMFGINACSKSSDSEEFSGNVVGVWHAVRCEDKTGVTEYDDNTGVVFTLRSNETYTWEVFSSNPNHITSKTEGTYYYSPELKTIDCKGTQKAGPLVVKDDVCYMIQKLTEKTLVVKFDINIDKYGVTTYTFKRI